MSTSAATRFRGLIGPSTRNSMWALIDQAIVSGTNFLTTIVIGRAASESELGLYSLAFTVMLFVANAQDSLVTMPYTIFGNRMEPGERRRFAGSALVHSGSLSAMSIVALVALAGVLLVGHGPAGSPSMFLVVAIVAPLILAREFSRRVSFAHLNMRAALIIDSMVSGLYAVGLAAFVLTGRLHARTTYLALGAACAITSGIWFWRSRREIEVDRSRVAGDWRRNWPFSRWIFAGQMVAVARGYSINWLLAIMLGTAATGIYSACLTVVFISNPFLLGILNILTPRLSRAIADGGRPELWRVTRKIALLVAGAMALFCVIMVGWGGQLVRLIYGEAFAGNGAVVALLGIAMLVASLDLAPLVGLRVLERADLAFRINLMGVVVMLAVAIAAIGPGGLVGVAFALLAGNLAVTVVAWITFRRAMDATSDPAQS